MRAKTMMMHHPMFKIIVTKSSRARCVDASSLSFCVGFYQLFHMSHIAFRTLIYIINFVSRELTGAQEMKSISMGNGQNRRKPFGFKTRSMP
jgi:hypothetical protein